MDGGAGRGAEMNILVGILSRHRLLGLAGMLGGLRTLESGAHDVRYVVLYDDDDLATDRLMYTFAQLHGDRIAGIYGPRPVTLGDALNKCADFRGWNWDAFVHLVDDCVPLCVGWDVAVENELKVDPLVAWKSHEDPTNPGLITFSRRWYDAAGETEPCWFPFWFGDTWVAEVHRFVTGRRLRISDVLVTSDGGHRGKTTGMRDLAFWFDFFRQTRPERLVQAGRIAQKLEGTVLDTDTALEEMRAWDEWQLGRIGLYERVFGNEGTEPSPRYLVARARAEDHLRDGGY